MKFIRLAADPTVPPGIQARISTLGLLTTTDTVYVKYGSAATAWMLASLFFAGGTGAIREIDDDDATVAQDDEVMVWTDLTATRTATLPSFAATPLGKPFTFENATIFAFDIVIDADGADVFVDGTGTATMQGAKSWMTVRRGPTSWIISDRSPFVNPTCLVVGLLDGSGGFDSYPELSYDVNGKTLTLSVDPGGFPLGMLIGNQGTTSSDDGFLQVDAASGSGEPRVELTIDNGLTARYAWRINQATSDQMELVTGAGSTVRGFVRLGDWGFGAISANATTATAFRRIRTMAGRPTGAPTAITGHAPESVDTTNYALDHYIASAWERMPIRCLNVQVSSVGNVGAGEDDLHTFSLPAATLARNGECVEVEYTLGFAANANNKRVRAYFGATTAYDTGGGVAKNDGSATINMQVFRDSATTQRIITTFLDSTNTVRYANATLYVTGAETLSGAVTIKVTGEATSNDDIVCRLSRVRFIPLGV